VQASGLAGGVVCPHIDWGDMVIKSSDMIAVFYDGQCGLCRREIDYYRRVAPAGLFDWVDIAGNAGPLAPFGISESTALRQLHARDAAGRWHVGVDAFLLIWRQLDYWWLLAGLVSIPGIKACARFCYRRFADYRFARLTHCQLALENDRRA